MSAPLPLPELLRLVRSIAEKAVIHRAYFDLDKFRPEFGAPAPSDRLRRVADLFDGLLPSDYLQVLGAFDGIGNFDVPTMRLLSTEELLSGADYLDHFVEAELFSAGEAFAIGKCDFDAHLVAFRKNPGGGLSVIDFDPYYDFGEYPSYSEYLVAREQSLIADIARFEEDRKGILND